MLIDDLIFHDIMVKKLNLSSMYHGCSRMHVVVKAFIIHFCFFASDLGSLMFDLRNNEWSGILEFSENRLVIQLKIKIRIVRKIWSKQKFMEASKKSKSMKRTAVMAAWTSFKIKSLLQNCLIMIWWSLLWIHVWIQMLANVRVASPRECRKEILKGTNT